MEQLQLGDRVRVIGQEVKLAHPIGKPPREISTFNERKGTVVEISGDSQFYKLNRKDEGRESRTIGVRFDNEDSRRGFPEHQLEKIDE